MLEREIIPHPDEQRTYAELREQFRAAASAHLRDQCAGYHPLGWWMIGDPSTARDRYDAESWAMEMDRRLLDPVTQDFGLDAVPTSMGAKLQNQAVAAMAHDDVTWPEGTEGTADADAPPCADVTTMTDDELAQYVDRSIKESAR